MSTNHLTFEEQLINRIRVDISTHKIANYEQLAIVLQLPNLVGEGGLFPSVKPTDRVTVTSFNALVKMLPAFEEKHKEYLTLKGKMHGEHPLDNTGWIPPAHPAQTATLFPHQTKAAKDIAYKLFIEMMRGVVLEAAAGHGKTFIFGQIIRWANDVGYLKDCYSPWPVLIITKSAQDTLVKQTERVMENSFGLRIPREVFVLSYDALRSGKGLSRMIKKEKKHVDGEIKYIYSWIQYLNPKLIVIDECQAARREDAIQTKVIMALADIIEYIKIIFSSATPFTRVSEARAICCNVGMEI